MISIVVPVYNSEKYLSHCLESVLRQSYSNIEVIIVDNNSTDCSKEIIDEYRKKDRRIIPLSCAKQGVSNARNLGIRSARGDYIFFLDSDDDLPIHSLSTLYIAAVEHNADITVCNYLRREHNKEYPQCKGISSRLAAEENEIAKLFYDLLPSYIMYNVFKLYSTNLLCDNHLLFDPGLSLGEDLLFNLETLSYANKIYYLNDTLYNHNIYYNGLNLRFRSDLVEIKEMLHQRTKAYLKKYGLFNERYYIVFINDIFAILANCLQYGEMKESLTLPCVQELITSDVFPLLSSRKKLIFLFIKHKLTPLLYLIIFCLRRRH